MRRRFEDELVQAAFEEVDPGRMADVARRAKDDPDASRAFDTYRQMREDLRALREVPQDQLSTERLRDAILQQGLKPAAPARTWGWLWMPASAAALAAFFVLYSPARMTAGPATVGFGSVPQSVATLDPQLSPKTFDLEPLDTSAKLEWVASTAAAEATPTRVRRNVFTSNRTLARHADRRTANPAAEVKVKAAIVSDEPSPYTGMAELMEAAATLAEPTPEPAIVLIGTEADADTGAHRATEVQTASNVLIGG